MEVSNVALNQFLERARKAESKDDVVRVINQALNHPNVFVFGEFFDIPAVQQLEKTEPNSYELLKIFAYGTLSDHKAKKFPNQLSEQQLTKLRKLTVISLSSDKKIIPYSELLQQLGLSNQRELDDLLIDCLYSGLIKGKLDHKRNALEVEHSIGRDLRPGQIDEVQSILTEWLEHSDHLLKTINEKIAHAHTVQERNKVHKHDLDQRIEHMKALIKTAMDSDMATEGAAGSGADFDDSRRKGRKTGKKGKGNFISSFA